MSTIANLNVKLTASIGAFASGMAAATKPLADFGSKVVSVGSQVFSLTGAISALAAGGGFALLVKNSMETIAATGRMSDQMGIATEKLTGLQYASNIAGVGAEALNGGLEKMLHSLGEAVAGGGEAGAAFQHLGLSAKELANMAPDEAFTSIADGLKNITNPAERAAVTMQIFGKSGQQLLPLLMQGADGIKAAQAEAQRLGLTFSRLDAAKVEAANASMKRLQAVFEGAAQTLAIQLAPFIEAAANKLAEFGMSGDGAGKKVVNAFEWVLTAVAKLADYFELLKAGWYGMKGVAAAAIFGVVKSLAVLISGVEWLSNKLSRKGHETHYADSFHALADALKGETKEAFDKAGESFDKFEKGVNATAVTQTFNEIRAKADENAKAVADNAENMRGAGAAADDWANKLKQAEENAKKITTTLEELHKQLAEFGMSEGDKKLFDLKALGASPDQLAEAKKILDQLAGLENAKKAADLIGETQKAITQFGMTDSQKKLADLQLPGVSAEQLDQAKKALEQLDALNAAKKKMDEQQQEGQSIFESTRSPLEKYESQIGKLSELLDAGAIDWDTYGRAIRQARQQLEETNKTQAPQLLQAGTAAAQRFAYDSHRGSQKLSDDDIARKQLAEQQEQRRIMLRIENNLRTVDDNVTTVVEI